MDLHPFDQLGIPRNPLMLAPLAGVTDHPFRRTCSQMGADLTYVEMLSATALIYQSTRTLDMAVRHASERLLGVQVTGGSAEDTAKAVAILHRMPFDTIDINMGCPVSKVVKTGCGSAILKDPERVRATVLACRRETDKPFSVKIRIGWDRNLVNGVEISQAAAESGADWITVHGRTRSDDYSVPVDLDTIADIVRAVKIPVIGNGNVFSRDDAEYMQSKTGVQGVMVSRGALGDPWVFARIKLGSSTVNRSDWERLIIQHLAWQKEAYGQTARAAVCMRKNLLWYCKGWPGLKVWKDEAMRATTLDDMVIIVRRMSEALRINGYELRQEFEAGPIEKRFHWDPKWEMDRTLDRGVGTDCMSHPR